MVKAVIKLHGLKQSKQNDYIKHKLFLIADLV
jgi:hypothetical protein